MKIHDQQRTYRFRLDDAILYSRNSITTMRTIFLEVEIHTTSSAYIIRTHGFGVVIWLIPHVSVCCVYVTNNYAVRNFMRYAHSQ